MRNGELVVALGDNLVDYTLQSHVWFVADKRNHCIKD